MLVHLEKYGITSIMGILNSFATTVARMKLECLILFLGIRGVVIIDFQE
jgi:hypothetical protein